MRTTLEKAQSAATVLRNHADARARYLQQYVMSTSTAARDSNADALADLAEVVLALAIDRERTT